jgi:transcriptional regulator with XRE-family HTH domain
MEFEAKLRELLKRHGMSQADLAESIGTYQTQVSRWLESNTPPKWNYLLKIARVFDVSVDFLVDPAQDEPPKPQLLPEDEAFILDQYRTLKSTGMIDKERAVAGLTIATRFPAGQVFAVDTSGGKTIKEADLTQSGLARAREEARASRPPSKAETDPIPGGKDVGSKRVGKLPRGRGQS